MGIANSSHWPSQSRPGQPAGEPYDREPVRDVPAREYEGAQPAAVQEAATPQVVEVEVEEIATQGKVYPAVPPDPTGTPTNGGEPPPLDPAQELEALKDELEQSPTVIAEQ